MFEAKLGEAKVFKLIVDAMKELLTEANLDCSKSGISLQTLDSSHVALCSLLLRSEGFQGYRCDVNTTFGLQMASLSKVLKVCDSKDRLELSAIDQGDQLNIKFEGDKRVSDFSLKLMDIDMEHLGIPPTEYQATVRMPSAEFQRIVRDMNTMGESCVIGVTKEGVKFSVSGDSGTGNIMLKADTNSDKEKELVAIQMEQPVEMTFALQYLNMFTKATPLCDTVTLSMAPGVPVVIEYGIDDIGYIRYYLAPKIDDEE